MNKRDYFIQALKTEAWRHRKWIFSAFTVTKLKESGDGYPEYPYELVNHEGVYAFYDPNASNALTLLDTPVSQPLFGYKEIFVIEPGELSNVKKATRTTYGNALFNAAAIAMPFGDRLPYINHKASAGEIEKLFVPKIVNDPTDGQVAKDMITVSMAQKHLAVMHDVVQNLDPICVQSTSPAMLGVKPEVIALRDRLLEENKDKLGDLTVVAGIIKQLVQADKDSFKGDPAEGFFIKDKQFAVIRLRTQILHGIEYSMNDDGGFELITKSLNEGWDFTKFPALNNSLRDGSYNRGAKTALGGEAVKFFYRRYQNSHLVKGDCGTKVTIPRRVTKANYSRLVGNYHVDPVNGLVLLDEATAKASIGKLLHMRDPAGCCAGQLDYCEICFGKSLEDAPEMIANVTSEVPSKFMSIFMAKMHGTQLRTTPVDFKFWFQ